MGHLLIAAALAATIPSDVRTAPQMLPDANPAMWVIGDHDTTIYLFGTFHALDGKTDWFNDEVLSAFAASDELVLETIVPMPVQTSVPAVRVRDMGPFAPVAGSASFLSTTKAVKSASEANGMSIAKGADAILREAAEGSGKPVSGLETFESQIGMFSKLPTGKAITRSAQPGPSGKALSTLLARLQAAWNRGDPNSFALMLDDMAAKSPDTYRLLFAERNERWADWIAARLDQPGTVFVAVGAGHLAGRDSVQAKLTTLGVGSARLN